MKGGAPEYCLCFATTPAPATTWICAGFSYDQSTTSITLMANSAFETPSPTISGSPSASNASSTMQIGASGNNGIALPSGTRMANFVMWEGTALSQSQMSSYFEATRGIFGV